MTINTTKFENSPLPTKTIQKKTMNSLLSEHVIKFLIRVFSLHQFLLTGFMSTCLSTVFAFWPQDVGFPPSNAPRPWRSRRGSQHRRAPTPLRRDSRLTSAVAGARLRKRFQTKRAKKRKKKQKIHGKS